MMNNIICNAAQVYETVKLNNSALLSTSIMLGFIFLVCLIVIIFKSGK